MEQKRIVWIIAAVGIFLLVIFGAAAILYSPSSRPVRTAATTPVEKRNVSGWTTAPAPVAAAPVQSEEPAPTAPETSAVPETAADSVTKVNDMTVIAQNTTVYGLQQQYPQTETSGTTIDLNTINKPTSPVSENVTPANEAGAQAIESVKEQTTVQTVKAAAPVTEEKPAAKTIRTVKKQAAQPAKSTPAKAKKAAQKSPTVTQYWVQAAAFTSKKSADNALNVLDDNKIPANVFTYKDAKGTLFYRVRVGPYVTKSEAEYWRARIVNIDTFAKTSSYVTSTKSAVN